MSVRTYVITTVCILSVIVGLLGNLAIIFVRIYKQCQRKQTTTYAFLICQLAIADFIFAFTVIFDIHALLNEDKWLFGTGVCKIIKTLQSTSVSTTIGFLTLMAYERYCGLSRPLQHHWSIKKTSFIVVGIWAYIIMTFIPFTLALGVNDGVCFEVSHPSENFRKGYTMFLFITNFVLPLILIVCFHSLIVKITRQHLRSIDRNSRHRGSTRTRQESEKEESFVEQNNSAISSKNTSSTKPCKNNNVVSTSSNDVERRHCVSRETPKKNEEITQIRKIKQYLGCMEFLHKLFPTKSPSPQLLAPPTTNPEASSGIQPKTTRFSLRKRITKKRRNYEDSKLVKMLVAVTLCFACMTLPTQIWYIWYDFGGSDQTVSPLTMRVLEVFASLVYMHCCVNCIIYSAMDKRFRTDLLNMFKVVFGTKHVIRRDGTLLTTTPSIRQHSRTNSSRLESEKESCNSPSPNLRPSIIKQHAKSDESPSLTVAIETVL